MGKDYLNKDLWWYSSSQFEDKTSCQVSLEEAKGEILDRIVYGKSTDLCGNFTEGIRPIKLNIFF